MLQILELFGGIGAPRKALENIGADIRSIDYVEILPYAVNAYNSIFDNRYKPQDVKTWDLKVDLLIHGSPCVDFSKNGLNDISTGRSILYEKTLEIIENKLLDKPKYVLWENVPNLMSERHIPHFNHYIDKLEYLGYTNYYKVLNSKYFDTPQNRERVYVVSILDDNKNFSFPKENLNVPSIREYIDYNADFEKYRLSDNEQSILFYEYDNLYVREATKTGYKLVEEFDTVNLERPNSKTRRGRVGKQIAQTITANPRQAIFYDNDVRMLTAKEHLKIMGFTDLDYERMKDAGLNDSSISALAGNSISVKVLEEIFKNLLYCN